MSEPMEFAERRREAASFYAIALGALAISALLTAAIAGTTLAATPRDTAVEASSSGLLPLGDLLALGAHRSPV